MNKNKNSFLLSLETISPVAVLDGGTLSPLTDYTQNFQKKHEALLLNHRSFENRLPSEIDLCKEFISKFENTVNEFLAEDFEIKKLLNKTKEEKEQKKKRSQNLNENKRTVLLNTMKSLFPNDYQNVFNERPIPINGSGNFTEIGTIIKENNIPIIPGSSIKGAIKNALFYNWIKKQDKEIGEIVKILSEINNIDKLIRIDNEHKDIIKQNKQTLNSFKDKIDKIFESLLDEFEGKISEEKRMPFSMLKVRDCYFKEFETAFYHCERFRLKDSIKGQKIPLFLEAIPEKKKSSFEIQVESLTDGNEFVNKMDISGVSILFEEIKEYSKDHIKHEIELATNENSELRNTSLNAYHTFLKERLRDCEKTDSAVFPLGNSKSNPYQSLALIIYRKSKDAYVKFINLYELVRKPEGTKMQKQLPVTRTLTSDSKTPLGWVRLTQRQILKNEGYGIGKEYQGIISKVDGGVEVSFKIENEQFVLPAGIRKDLKYNSKFKKEVGLEVKFEIRSLDKETCKIKNIEITGIL